MEEAEAQLRLAALEAQSAEHKARQARDAAAALVAAEIAGEVLTVEDVDAAHAAALKLERYATHKATVYRARHEPIEAAKAALADAKHEAWAPVMRKGQDYRISAGAKADRARMLAQCGDGATDMQRALAAASADKAMAAARPEWDRGTALIDLAVHNGHRWKADLSKALSTWGDKPRESYERMYWRRPLAEETQDVAA